MRRPRPRRLSAREAEVIRLAACGLTAKEIAQRLDLSRGTIGTYWGRCRAKLQVPTRAACVAAYLSSANAAKILETEMGLARWRTLLHNVSDGVLLISSRRVVLELNMAAAQMLGVSRDYAVGKPIRDLGVTLVDDEGRPLAESDYPAVRCLQRSDTLQGERFVLQLPVGRPRKILVSAEPVRHPSGAAPNEALVVFRPTA